VSSDPYAAPTANLENMTAAPVVQTKIMSAKGRLSVLSYLAQGFVMMIALTAIIVVLGIVGATVTGFSPESFASPETIDFSNPVLIALMVLAAIIYAAMIVISIILMIKRLHDRNHSGWWVLALYVCAFIPVVNIVAIFGFLYVMFWPGQKTGNRFGGRRPTKGWEKVLGIIAIVIFVASIVAAFAMGGAAFMSMSGVG